MGTTKKAKKAENKVVKTNSKGKTEIVLKMVEQGKTRKDIIDKLVSMDESVSRKSNAGLVCHIFKAHNLIGKVPSGVDRKKKKEVKVKEKTSNKKIKKVNKAA